MTRKERERDREERHRRQEEEYKRQHYKHKRHKHKDEEYDGCEDDDANNNFMKLLNEAIRRGKAWAVQQFKKR